MNKTKSFPENDLDVAAKELSRACQSAGVAASEAALAFSQTLGHAAQSIDPEEFINRLNLNPALNRCQKWMLVRMFRKMEQQRKKPPSCDCDKTPQGLGYKSGCLYVDEWHEKEIDNNGKV